MYLRYHYTFYIKYSQKIDGLDYHKLEEVSKEDLQIIKNNIKNSKYIDNELEEVRKNISNII